MLESFAVFINICSLLECAINEYAITANIIDTKTDTERDKKFTNKKLSIFIKANGITINISPNTVPIY